MDSIAVYVHTPFCPSKCGYCDFNSYAMDGEIVERTVRAICKEIHQSPFRGVPAKTIFFGGGTPTFLSALQLDSLLQAVFEGHPPVPGCEITSEANPGTVDATKFGAMRRSGWNRISLGAQSFLDSDLLRLERVHKAGEIERAVLAAREAGFDNVNLDLMFALPDQSRHAWRANLERALALQPEHLSLYCLTIEQNTAFYKKNLRGELNLPDDDSQREMYEDCLRICTERGYEQYEISNFSKPGRECQHNLCYWFGEAYAGYGPGAVGCVPESPTPTPPPLHQSEKGEGLRESLESSATTIAPTSSGAFTALPNSGGGQLMAPHPPLPTSNLTRYTNFKHPEGYCTAVETSAKISFESEIIDASTQRVERIMLGLRLNRGVSREGMPLGALDKLEQRGWIGRDDQKVWLTAEGRHFCSEVALELI